MKRSQTVVTALAIVCALQAGWLAAGWFGGSARADDPYALDGAAPTAPFQLLCRTFTIDANGEEFTIPGSNTEAGRWANSHPELMPYTVDYEAVQKATGYPEHLMQVCLSPR